MCPTSSTPIFGAREERGAKFFQAAPGGARGSSTVLVVSTGISSVLLRIRQCLHIQYEPTAET